MTENLKIVFLGTAGFPYGMAEVEKQKLIAKSLILQGSNVEFICKKSFNPDNNIPYKGSFEGIKYIFTNLSAKKQRNFILRHLSWKFGAVFEKIYLLYSKYDYQVVSSRSFFEILGYVIINRLKGKKLYLTSVEDANTMITKKSYYNNMKLKLFNKYVWKIVDGAFPISEELKTQIILSNPSLPLLKIPVLVDFELFHNIDDSFFSGPEYFMFCGSVDYINTITFILNGYDASECNSKLLLVINGQRKKRDIINKKIENLSRKNDIVIKTNLSQEELYKYYKNAKALLIPLNFDQRDKARFPHKIGEYCASRVPIITSAWGEIPYYFKSGENALLLNTDCPEELKDAFLKLDRNKELCNKLADGSYNLALTHFNYKNYGSLIIQFMMNS
jgi:glycosyltransferase involved in cell wall biosynthesis